MPKRDGAKRAGRAPRDEAHHDRTQQRVERLERKLAKAERRAERTDKLERRLAKATAQAADVERGSQVVSALEKRLEVTQEELARRPSRSKQAAHAPGTSAGFLFVTGCPRSGSGGLANVLNQDDRILVGNGRYASAIENLEPFLFAPEVFRAPIAAETDAEPADGAAAQPDLDPGRWERLAYIGDSSPRYSRHLDRLAGTFRGSRIIFIVRDLLAVIDSFAAETAAGDDGPLGPDGCRRIINEWNDALRALRQFVDRGHAEQVLVLRAEELLAGSDQSLQRVFRFLELDPPSDGDVTERFHAAAKEWEETWSRPPVLDDELRTFTADRRDPGIEAWLSDHLSSAPARRRRLLRRGA